MWKPSWSVQFTWFIVDKMRKPNGAEKSAPGLKIWNFTWRKFTDCNLRTNSQNLRATAAVKCTPCTAVNTATLSSSLRVNKRYGAIPFHTISNNYMTQATKLRRQTPWMQKLHQTLTRGELNSSKTRSFKSASICQDVVQWGTKRLTSCSFAWKLGYFVWIYLDLMILKIHQDFCAVIHKGGSPDHNNVAMRQLCRKHEKLQMPRWWKSWVLPLNFRNPPIGLDLPMSKDILPYSKIYQSIHPSLSKPNLVHQFFFPKSVQTKWCVFPLSTSPPPTPAPPNSHCNKTTVETQGSGPASSWNSSTTSFGAQITRLASSGDTCNSLGRWDRAPMPNNHALRPMLSG